MKNLLMYMLLTLGSGLVSAQALAENPSPLWRVQTGGAIWSNPVADDTHLWVGSDDHNLYQLAQASGEILWQFTSGGRIRSEPALGDNHVYFTADDGYLYAVDKTNGKLHYRVLLGEDQQQRQLPAYEENNRFDWPGSSPLLSGRTLYTGSASGELYALEAATGKLLWRFASEGVIRSRPALFGNTLVAASWDGNIYGIDAASGEKQWQFATGAPVLSNIAPWQDLAIIGGRSAALYAIRAETGELAWTFQHESGSWIESSATVEGDRLYIGSSDALQLLCLDTASGKVHWTYTTGGWSWGTPAVADGRVYIGSFAVHPHWQQNMTRGLHVITADSGESHGFYPATATQGYITGGVATRPLITNTAVITAALDGSIQAYPPSR